MKNNKFEEDYFFFIIYTIYNIIFNYYFNRAFKKDSILRIK